MALFLFEDDNFWNEKKKLVKVPFSFEKIILILMKNHLDKNII